MPIKFNRELKEKAFSKLSEIAPTLGCMPGHEPARAFTIYFRARASGSCPGLPIASPVQVSAWDQVALCLQTFFNRHHARKTRARKRINKQRAAEVFYLQILTRRVNDMEYVSNSSNDLMVFGMLYDKLPRDILTVQSADRPMMNCNHCDSYT